MSRRRLLLTLANAFKWLKDKFIYIYNSIIPSKLPSVNLWDEEWEVGGILADSVNSKNFISVVANAKYYFKCPNGEYGYVIFYDINKNRITPTATGEILNGNAIFTTPLNACYMKFRMRGQYGTTYNHDVCINVSNPQINGIYYPYKPRKVQDKARLTLVEGNSEVENQYFSTNKATTTENGITYSIDGNHIVASGTCSSAFNIVVYSGFSLISGHSYLVYLTINKRSILPTPSGYSFWQIYKDNPNINVQVNENDPNVNKLFVANVSTTFDFRFRFQTNNQYDYDYYYHLVDLTKTYPFDTPTSINYPRVQNIIRQGYKDFNAGEIKDSVVSEIEHRRVPKGYKELTYIESSGTQYINSGLYGKYGMKTYAKINVSNAVSDTACLLGSRNGDGSRLYLGYRQYNGQINIGYKTEMQSSTSPIPNNTYEFEYEIANLKATIKKNGETILEQSVNDTTFTGTYPMYIFAGNIYGSVQAYLSCKLYALKIWDNGNLVRDFIPCYRESDNVIGLYDAVNGVFYTNAGTGTFIKGEEVEYTNNKITLPQPLKLGSAGSVHNTFEITKDNYVFTRKVFDVELDGSSDEEWVLTSYQRFYIGIDGWKSPSSSIPANLICNKLATSKKEGLDLYENVISGGDPNTWNIFVRINSSIDTIEKLRTWLASNKLNVKYELATPQVINIPRKHLGCVRLKDLEWQYFSGANARFLASSISNIKVVGSNSDVVNAFCSKYRTESWSGVFNHVSDKVIGEASSGIVGVYDSSYTNADDFKASLTDQDILFYETESEVADFIDELECQPNGVLNANQSRVPHEYQEVEYINISGYDFVNTGVIGNLNTKIVVDFYAVAMSTNKTWANVGIGGNYIQPNLSMDGTYRTSRFSDKTITTVNVLSVGNRYKLEIDKTSLRLNGNVLDYFNATASFETPYYLRIGAITNIAGDYVDGSNNFYSCQIYDNDVLVRNFIPCFRKSDGVIGLYDVVEGKFYTNQGTGTFLKGGNIESPICEVLPNVEVELKCK